MAKTIPTKRIGKGDLVKGHRVFAIMGNGLPAVPGVIIEASDSSATMQVGEVLSIFGLPRRTRWTWRRSVQAYQQDCTRTRQGVGLVLDARPKPKD